MFRAAVRAHGFLVGSIIAEKIEPTATAWLGVPDVIQLPTFGMYVSSFNMFGGGMG